MIKLLITHTPRVFHGSSNIKGGGDISNEALFIIGFAIICFLVLVYVWFEDEIKINN